VNRNLNKSKIFNPKHFPLWTLLAAMGFLLLSSIPAQAAFLPVQVYATDAIAGYPSAMRTSLVDPFQEVRFVVEKPDGSVVQIPAQAEADGVARSDFYGHQTKTAGTYKVSVVFAGKAESSPQASFTVFPDSVSPTQSTVRSTIQMPEAGTDPTFLVVTLYDSYRNPVSDHQVRLISSRSDDKIEVLQGGVTDRNGRANFKVTSKYPGVSVYTAYDITLNQVLEDREELVFIAPVSLPTQPSSPFAANLFAANIGGDEVLPGPVDRFDIQGLPSTAQVGEELTLTVIALDKNGNTAKNYTGTILISVPDDENAVLPNNGEYTFKASDQGKFTFSLSLQFSKLGNQVVQVFDKANFRISGEKSIEIVPRGGVVPAQTTSAISVKTPSDGAQLGSTFVILTGTGPENINLKVFDNDSKIGDSETDGDGYFSFEARGLDDGQHVFYIMTEDDEVSKSVSVTIDTIPPVMNSFELDPEGDVVPAEPVTVTVSSEPALAEASVRLQGVMEKLTETDPGNYEATLVSPAGAGTYGIDVVLVDNLSNKGEFLNKGFISVRAPEPVYPPAVMGLEGEPADSAIRLKWLAVEGHDSPVAKYRIHYGTTMDRIDRTVDTIGPSLTWELRELNNGTQYFVQVRAVDVKDYESSEPGLTIAVTPVAPDPCKAVECGEHGTCQEGTCFCSDNWSGVMCDIPPVAQPPVITPPVSAQGPLSVTPADSGVQVSWIPFGGSATASYQVRFGVYSGQYVDAVTLPSNVTQIHIQDLINGIPYYFTVAALDYNGVMFQVLNQEVSAVPSGYGLRPSAPSPVPYDTSYNPPVPSDYSSQLGRAPASAKSGPESLWIVIVSLVVTHFLYHHKKKVLNSVKY
jgi:hypothetical protein